jgi:competence ComEA-like helix-hairpin-helix protein
VLLLLGLAVAGQGVRTWLGRPDDPPGQVTLLPPDTTGALARQRARSLQVGRPLAPGERIDLDRAPADEIARLPRIGLTLAKAIVADRAAHGPFGSLQGLDRVAGVGPGLLGAIGERASFSGVTDGQTDRRSAVAMSTSPLAASGAVDSSVRLTVRPSLSPTLNLNSADSAAFETLPGIGPFMAGRIVAYRKKHGPFTSVQDLTKVGGIGPVTLAKVREKVVVE